MANDLPYRPCRNGCEFTGTASTGYYCSRCYKERTETSAVPADPQPPKEADICSSCRDFFGSEEYGGLCHSCFMKKTKHRSSQDSQLCTKCQYFYGLEEFGGICNRCFMALTIEDTLGPAEPVFQHPPPPHIQAGEDRSHGFNPHVVSDQEQYEGILPPNLPHPAAQHSTNVFQHRPSDLVWDYSRKPTLINPIYLSPHVADHHLKQDYSPQLLGNTSVAQFLNSDFNLMEDISRHTSVLIGCEVYIWGEFVRFSGLLFPAESSSVFVFNVLSSMSIKKLTTGTPPSGVIDYGSCCVGDDIYYFGGRIQSNDDADRHEKDPLDFSVTDADLPCSDDFYHHSNNLSVLNTTSNKWRQITCSNGPMEKAGCGMIPFSINGEDYILVIGGRGRLPSNPPSHAQYTPCRGDSSHCFTNEVHIMCISSTPGKWTVPMRTGSVFPPSAHFSINALPGNRAIIFGGLLSDEDDKFELDSTFSSPDVFIVSYTNNTIDFQRLGCSASNIVNVPRHIGRRNHSSVVISSVSGNGREKDYLLVLGGKQGKNGVVADCWVMEITKDTTNWKQISLPVVVAKRKHHSMCCYNMSDNCKWLIVSGGTKISRPNRLMIVELVFSPTDDNWTVTNVLNEKDMQNTANYSKLVIDRLLERRGRKEYQQMASKLSLVQERLKDERRAHSFTKQKKDEIIHQKERQDVIIQRLKKSLIEQKQENAFPLVLPIGEVESTIATESKVQLMEKIQYYIDLLEVEQKKSQWITMEKEKLKNEQPIMKELKDRRDEDDGFPLKERPKLKDLSDEEETNKEQYEDAFEAVKLCEDDVLHIKLMEKEKEIQHYKDQLEVEQKMSRGKTMEIEELKKSVSPMEGDDCTVLKQKEQYKDQSIQFNYMTIVNDCLDNVHVGGEAVYLIQGRSVQSFNWSEWGLRIHFSEDSLAPPVGVVSSDPTSTPTLCSEVAVKALVGGKFQLPKGSELVSAVYAISFANKLRKPVQLEIQHCAVVKSESQFKQLTFVKAPMRQRVPPFEFNPLEGGEFSIDSQWGSITLDHFCLIAIILMVKNIPVGVVWASTHIQAITTSATFNPPTSITSTEEGTNDVSSGPQSEGAIVNNISTEDPVVNDDGVWTDSDQSSVSNDDVKLSYSGQLFYNRYGNGMNRWSVWFMAVKDITALKTYIQREHPNAEADPPIAFGFHGDNGVLELVIDQKCSCDGWTLYPNAYPLKLCQEHMNMFGREAGVPSPPSCQITITVSDPSIAQDLHYCVPIGGVVCNAEMIFIRRLLDQESSSSRSHVPPPHGAVVTTSSHVVSSEVTLPCSSDVDHVDVFQQHYIDLVEALKSCPSLTDIACDLRTAKLVTRNTAESIQQAVATGGSLELDQTLHTLLKEMKAFLVVSKKNVNLQRSKMTEFYNILKKPESLALTCVVSEILNELGW